MKAGPAATRRRIVEATVALHEEVGPAATTISAIAERAGVQRLTVYRHFPEERELLGACSAHWVAAHPFPDPAAWAGVEDPAERMAAALASLYGYYRSGARMLGRVLRDEEGNPALAEVNAPFHAYLREVAGLLSAGWGAGAETQRRLRAAVGHAVRFESWRSLAAEGLGDAEAAEVMAVLVAGLAGRSDAVVRAGPARTFNAPCP